MSNSHSPLTDFPKAAIDPFVQCFEKQFDVIHNWNRQLNPEEEAREELRVQSRESRGEGPGSRVESGETRDSRLSQGNPSTNARTFS